MPKKKKSGKKKSSKKSKKDAGATSKVATAEEKLWARRYKISEESRKVHRSNASTLVSENDQLSKSLQYAERDALEVMNHFKNEISEQVQENVKLDQTFSGFRRDVATEKNTITRKFEKEIQRLNGIVEQQSRRIKKSEGELESLKEWQLAKDDLRKELDLLKTDNDAAKREYEEFLEKREEKYFEEKVRTRKETDAEIARLAESAHSSAVAKLDETTKNVYKENVKISTELAINKKEIVRLTKQNEIMTDKLHNALSCKEDDTILVKQSVIKTKRQEKEIHQLKERALTLETALSHVVREFEHERALLVVRNEENNEDIRGELTACQRALKLKTAENKRIRHLAKYVVQQRSELELFFHEALSNVTAEIATSRALFAKEVKGKHTRLMLEGLKTGLLPPIRTFNAAEASTNSMDQIFNEASVMPDLSSGVAIEDLTWEQKEQVLRRLFAKMNTVASTNAKAKAKANVIKTLSSPSRKTGGEIPRTITESNNEEDDQLHTSFFITDHDPTNPITT